MPAVAGDSCGEPSARVVISMTWWRGRRNSSSPSRSTAVLVAIGRGMCCSSVLVQLDTGEVGELVEQVLVEALVVDGGRRGLGSLMVPVAAGDGGGPVVARGEPDLGDVAEDEVVGGVRSTHPGRHPPGVDG